MWQACVQLALRQEGLLTLDQALGLGYSAPALRHRVEKGELERVVPGVFRLVASASGARQQLRAVCLWGGDGTAASHTSAAALLKIKGFNLTPLHAVTTKNPGPLPGWVHPHRVDAAWPGIQTIAGIAVTPPWITLIDLACLVSKPEAERAFGEALRLGLVSIPQMRWAVATFGRKRHRGTAIMSQVLDELGPGYAPPESELEELFYSIIEASDLPPGKRQHWVHDGRRWRRYDWAVLEVKVGVEVDGLKTHGTEDGMQDDRARDRRLKIQGWDTLRYTALDITQSPQEMVAEIRQVVFSKMQE